MKTGWLNAPKPLAVRFALRTIIALLVMTVLIVGLVGQREYHLVRAEMQEKLEYVSRSQVNIIAERIDSLKDNIRIYAQIPPVKGLVRASLNNGFDPEDKTTDQLLRIRLDTVFSAFMNIHADITQLRFIGLADHGRELVRVDRRQDIAAVIPDGALQAKGDRDYFLATASLAPGQIYVSDITLNQEHGVIEQPFVPTLRIAIPVFAAGGKPFGILVINLDVTTLLRQIGSDLPQDFNAYLENSRGDFALHPDSSKVFGSDLGHPWGWQDEFHPVAGDDSAAARDFMTSQGRIHVVTQRLLLDNSTPKRALTLAITVPDRVIARAVRQVQLYSLLTLLALYAVVALLARWYFGQTHKLTLQRSELAAIVASSQDAIIGKTLEGVVTSWNKGAEQVFGYSAEEAVGRTLVSLIVPANAVDEEASILQRIGQGIVVASYDTVRRRKDGSLVDVAVSVSPIRTADGRIIGASKTARDVTERKAIEAQLQELNRSLEQQVAERTTEILAYSSLQRAILDNAGYAIIACDATGLITIFNPAAELMLGYSADEAVGKLTPLAFHDPAEVTARAQEFSAALGEAVDPGFAVLSIKAERNLPNEHEWVFTDKDGLRFPVRLLVTALRRIDGGIYGYLGIAVDISEQRQTQQELLGSNRFLETLADNIPSMVSYWDTNLRCHFANHTCLDWFGRSRRDITGMSMPDMFGDAFDHNQATINAILRGEPQKFERVLTKVNHENSYVIVDLIPDSEDGQVRGFIILATEITDLKQAQLTLETLNAQLEARTREAEAATRSKSEFLANMSHEIRTPLNAIIGLGRLLEDARLAPREQDYVVKLRHAGETLLAIINDILDFSKIEAGHLHLEQTVFSLEDVVRNVALMVATTTRETGVETIVMIDPALPERVIGDPLRLSQILINLAGNAAKFTKAGEIVITLGKVSESDDQITTRFSVRDTGIGIPADRHYRLFQAFSQADSSTSRKFGGTGLGLAISGRLVALMGGSIDFTSAPGEGSEFWFTTSFGRGPAEPAKASSRTVSDLKEVTICAVDDNATARTVLSQTCRIFGWSCHVADSGEACLDLLRSRQQQDSDILLVDWKMPGMDGIEMIRRAKQDPTIQLPPIILMLSAFGVEEIQPFAAELGLAGFLSKPFTPSLLFDTVALLRTGARHASPERMSLPSLAGRLPAMTLLLVEDNDVNQHVANDILTRAGATVEIVGNGRLAVDELRRHPDRFDLVLMDIQMPEMDGYEATRLIRHDLQLLSLPIIAMTAHALPEDREKSRAAGMQGHVAKPIDIDELFAVLIGCLPVERRVLPSLPQAAMLGVALPPALPGIDMAGVMARMGGDYLLLVKLLPQFADSYAAKHAVLQQSLAARDWPAAQAMLHQIRGAAGNIGAATVAQLAEEGGTRIAQGDLVGIESLLPRLDQAMTDVRTAAGIAGAWTGRMNVALPGGQGDLSVDDLRHLQDLVSKNNLRAMDLFLEWRPRLRLLFGETGVAAIGHALETLDFDSALRLITDLTLTRGETA